MPTPMYLKLSELPVQVVVEIRHAIRHHMNISDPTKICVCGYDEQAEREHRPRQLAVSALRDNFIAIGYGMRPNISDAEIEEAWDAFVKSRVPASYMRVSGEPILPKSEPEEERMSNWSRWDEI